MLPWQGTGGVSVKGSVKTMSLEDVFAWLDRRKLSGALSATRGPLTRRLQVAAGALTAASSTNPVDYLGQILLNRGLLTEDRLRAVYAALPSRAQSLGTALVADGLVDAEILRDAIEEKIRESVFDLLAWPDGSFEFDPSARTTSGQELEVSLSLAGCLTEGASRAAEWRAIRDIIPRDDVRFFVVDPTLATDERERKILGDVQRGLTAADLMLEHHSLPYGILRDLVELVGRGAIRVDRRVTLRPGGTQMTPGALMQAAEGRARGGDKLGALKLARRALDAAPEDDQLKKGYAAVERAVFAELSRTLLTQFRVPRLLRSSQELATMELSSEERYFLGRIDGRWDLLSLLRVAPLRELDSLLTLQQMANRGLITLE
jgi:Domain of unknown function (DUF4388)